MGIGMVLAVTEENLHEAIEVLEQQGEKAYIIGRVTKEAGLTIGGID